MNPPDLILLIPPTLPGGDAYCFTGPQQFATDIINGTSAQMNPLVGLQPYNYGDSTPAVDKRIFPWFRTIGGYPDGWYQFLNGYWLKPHPVPAGDSERRIWVASDTALLTYDGGEAGAVGLYSGPMWEIDHTLDGRFPIGAATLPVTTTVIAVNSTGGEEEHKLTTEEMPAHNHTSAYSPVAKTALWGNGGGPGGTTGGLEAGTDYLGSELSQAGGDVNGDTVPHNNLPPYIGVYFIKRTGRQFYRL